jgi:hypothetical protein
MMHRGDRAEPRGEDERDEVGVDHGDAGHNEEKTVQGHEGGRQQRGQQTPETPQGQQEGQRRRGGSQQGAGETPAERVILRDAREPVGSHGDQQIAFEVTDERHGRFGKLRGADLGKTERFDQVHPAAVDPPYDIRLGDVAEGVRGKTIGLPGPFRFVGVDALEARSIGAGDNETRDLMGQHHRTGLSRESHVRFPLAGGIEREHPVPIRL